MRDYNAEFNQLMKEVIAPSLKDMGFMRKANKFRRTTNDLIPKSNVSIATSSDGIRVETKSEPKINHYFLEAIQRLASKYNIELN